MKIEIPLPGVSLAPDASDAEIEAAAVAILPNVLDLISAEAENRAIEAVRQKRAATGQPFDGPQIDEVRRQFRDRFLETGGAEHTELLAHIVGALKHRHGTVA